MKPLNVFEEFLFLSCGIHIIVFIQPPFLPMIWHLGCWEANLVAERENAWLEMVPENKNLEALCRSSQGHVPLSPGEPAEVRGAFLLGDTFSSSLEAGCICSFPSLNLQNLLPLESKILLILLPDNGRITEDDFLFPNSTPSGHILLHQSHVLLLFPSSPR